MLIATVTLVYTGHNRRKEIFVTTIATEHTDFDLLGKILKDEYRTTLLKSLSQKFRDCHAHDFKDSHLEYAIEAKETPIANPRADNARSTVASCMAGALQKTREHVAEEGFDDTEAYFHDYCLDTRELRRFLDEK